MQAFALLVIPEPIEDQDVFGDQLIHLLGGQSAGGVIGRAAGVSHVLDFFAAQWFDQMVAPDGDADVLGVQVSVDAVQIGGIELGGVLALTTLAYRSEEHTSELQSLRNLVCRLLLEKKTRIESWTETKRVVGFQMAAIGRANV